MIAEQAPDVLKMDAEDASYRSLTQSLARAHAFDPAEWKCSGIDCERRVTCDLHTRPEVPNQKWASFYAFPECPIFTPGRAKT